MEASRKALTSDDHDELHLLERINIDLQVQNSIVPSAHSLARFKVSGHLPNLQINLSDTKYKSLMRLIDVSIPHFDDDTSTPARPPLDKRKSGAFRLPGGIFGIGDQTYRPDNDLELSDTEDETESKGSQPGDEDDDDEFFEAQAGSVEVTVRVKASTHMLIHIS